MYKILLTMAVLICSALSLGFYQVGDVVTDFTWEDSDGGAQVTRSVYGLIDQGQALVFNFGGPIMPSCLEAASQLETIWQDYKDDETLHMAAAVIGDNDWESINGAGWRAHPELTVTPLTYNLSTYNNLGSHFTEFSYGTMPYSAVIGADYKVIYSSSGFSVDDMRVAIEEATQSFLSLELVNPVADQRLDFNESIELNLSNLFTTTGSDDIILSVVSVSAEDVVNAVLDGSTLTLTALDVHGTSTVKIKAECGSETAFDEFNVEVDIASAQWLEWGTDYSYSGADCFGSGTGDWSAATDFDIGQQENYNVTQIEVGYGQNEQNISWKVVEFKDGKPSEDMVGTLSGMIDVTSGQPSTIMVDNSTEFKGHVALVLSSGPNFMSTDRAVSGEHSYMNSDGQWKTLTQIGFAGTWNIRMKVVPAASDILAEIIPYSAKLYQNYPNPFNPNTEIKFYNDHKGMVKLSVFNVKGEMVKNLLETHMDAGFHRVNFKANQLHSGLYYYALEVNGVRLVKKMMLVK